jgi:hypothetical protein
MNAFERSVKSKSDAIGKIENPDLSWTPDICLAILLCDIPGDLYGIRNQVASDFNLGSRYFTSPQKPKKSGFTNSSR